MTARRDRIAALSETMNALHGEALRQMAWPTDEREQQRLVARIKAAARRERPSKSGVPGVHWNSRRQAWRAWADGRSVGFFATVEEARRAQEAAQ